MTVDKFGRYLYHNKSGKASSHLLQITKKQVNFEDRLLRNVGKGILKNDVVVKSQLDEAMVLCLSKIKDITQTLQIISAKIQSNTTPTPNSGGKKQSPTRSKPNSSEKKHPPPPPPPPPPSPAPQSKPKSGADKKKE